MLPRILYHMGLLEYEGNFPSSHRFTPRFWQTLELRRDARIRQAFLVKRLEAQLAELLQITPSDRRSRFRS
jgi:hypothetical protein